MFVRPIWAIFAFVASSILLAGGYHALTLSGADHNPFWSNSMSNEKFSLAFLTDEKLWGKSAPSCDAGDLQLWKDLPPIFRSARYRHGGDFQEQCLTASGRALPSTSDVGSCVRPANACGVDEEIMITYNVMLDVTDCYEIAQREFLPLVASQTGPRLAMMGVDDKQGLVSTTDWIEFQSAWPQELKRLKTSDRGSCRRLGTLFARTPTAAARPCAGSENAQSALIVMLASAKRFREVTDQITVAWDPALIDAHLAELDTRIEDRLALRYFTHLLAYFEDSTRAMAVTKAFVERRNDESLRIKPGELAWRDLKFQSRQPASIGANPSVPIESSTSLSWGSHLRNSLTPSAQLKMARVADWLEWVREHDLASTCATELWTMPLTTEE